MHLFNWDQDDTAGGWMRQSRFAAALLIVFSLSACQTGAGAGGGGGFFSTQTPVEAAQSHVAKENFYAAHVLVEKNPDAFDPAKATKDTPEQIEAFMVSFRPWVVSYLDKRADGVIQDLNAEVHSNTNRKLAMEQRAERATKRLAEFREMQALYGVEDGQRVLDLVEAIDQASEQASQLAANELKKVRAEDLVGFLSGYGDKEALVTGSTLPVLLSRLAELPPSERMLAIHGIYEGRNKKVLRTPLRQAHKELVAMLQDLGLTKALSDSLVDGYLAELNFGEGVIPGRVSGPKPVFGVWETEQETTPFAVTLRCEEQCMSAPETSVLSLGSGTAVILGRPYMGFARNPVDVAKVVSKHQVGKRTVANPSYPVAEENAAQALINLVKARNQQNSFSAQGCYGLGCVFSMVGSVAALAAVNEAKAKYDSALATLNNTPQYIDEAVLEGYQYTETQIEAIKGFYLPVAVVGGNGETVTTTIVHITSQNYKIATGVSPNDRGPGRSAMDLRDLAKEEGREMSFSLVEFYDALFRSEFDKAETRPMVYWAKLDAGDFLEQHNNVALAQGSARPDEATSPYAHLMESVVRIDVSDGLGSGFFLTPSLILTNDHVVGSDTVVDVMMYSGDRLVGQVLATDPFRDIALIKVAPAGKPLPLHVGKVVAGLDLLVLGNPNGHSFSVSKGIVSATRPRSLSSIPGSGTYTVVQTDAAVSGGNSGGPMVVDGRVVALVAFSDLRDSSEGLNFGPHVDELRDFLRQHGVSYEGS